MVHILISVMLAAISTECFLVSSFLDLPHDHLVWQLHKSALLAAARVNCDPLELMRMRLNDLSTALEGNRTLISVEVNPASQPELCLLTLVAQTDKLDPRIKFNLAGPVSEEGPADRSGWCCCFACVQEAGGRACVASQALERALRCRALRETGRSSSA